MPLQPATRSRHPDIYVQFVVAAMTALIHENAIKGDFQSKESVIEEACEYADIALTAILQRL